MPLLYFNFEAHLATDRWETRQTLLAWWRLAARDPSWTPPHYALLSGALRSDALQKRTIALLRLEAMSRQLPTQRRVGGMSAVAFPQAGLHNLSLPHPVATALLLRDSAAPSLAYFALFSCINEPRTRDVLLETMAELARDAGCRELRGPLGPLPFLQSGCQESHWDRPVPVDAPYSPPYMGELLAQRLGPLRLSGGAPAGPTRLYHVPVSPAAPVSGPATLAPLATADPAALVALLRAALPAGLPAADAEMATLLQRWLGHGRLSGWLALMAGQPAGFLLLRRDNRRWMRRLGGGRHLAARAILGRLAPPDPVGYVPLAAVLPALRGQGIGRQLWAQAQQQAAADGLQGLLVGPVGREQADATRFLQRSGTPEAAYQRFALAL